MRLALHAPVRCGSLKRRLVFAPQTLRMQLNMKRKADGSPSTPATERKNSKVPSAALLCTELASLYQKHSAMVKSAILHGTKRLEVGMRRCVVLGILQR